MPNPQPDPRPLALIVDDHLDSGEVCATFLETMGFETSVACNAAQGIRLAQERPPDVIITDIAMPGVDGWTVIQAVRTNPLTRDVPIVVLTGHVDASTRTRAVQAGCNAFIAKPCDPAHLAETLRLLVPRAPIVNA